jgi:hypothetical protein
MRDRYHASVTTELRYLDSAEDLAAPPSGQLLPSTSLHLSVFKFVDD